MNKKGIQKISPNFLLLDSTDIKLLSQVAIKVFRCLLSFCTYLTTTLVCELHFEWHWYRKNGFLVGEPAFR